jgi:hypothetical protein
MTTIPTIVEFTTEWLKLGLSLAQETLLRALYGLSLTEEMLDLWRRCTGRTTYPSRPFYEATVVAGARSGKDSRILVPVQAYEALFGGHEQALSTGEVGIIPIVAPTERSAQVAYRYFRGHFEREPLASLVEEIREQEIRLRNRIYISCFSCTGRNLRGWSFCGGAMDELAFFRVESGSDADVEIETAIRRGMAGFEHARLVKISTPYAKGGLLFDDYTRYYGQEDAEVLVWQAPTTLMNPTITEARLARDRRKDAARSAREYDALFSDDIENFLAAAWIESAVVDGRHELPPAEGVRYLAAVDPTGGGADTFTLAIIHLEGRRFVQDLMKGWAGSRSGQVDLAAICTEIASILRRYGLYRVTGDRYAGAWPAQEFRKAGVLYVPAEIDKSHCYQELEPALAQQRLELLDHPALLRELRLLEKRYKLGGKTPTIDHPRGGHDDHANALALAVAELAKSEHPAIGGTLESFARRSEESQPQRRGPRDPAGDGDPVERRTGFWGRPMPRSTRSRTVGTDLETSSRRGGFWR